ncbi:Predicted transcriptional regulator [Quadrisphaera granulorum]|uniref:Putative transcriptional regulator n=1 Tax=Quadrisphaera granulorum TaxID=317664 RepID=A0A316ADZ3_9ACTN|nr:hypothetical protein [Quadrisphaera granulorum]PWJ55104.1 putative transcriptional regulator [Quadrisphaera granulorum]SZE95613.1 Predicted transcriptional regulator [Quadrisphaera granulorum]
MATLQTFRARCGGPDLELRLFAEEVAASSLPGGELFAEVTPGSWGAALGLAASALPTDGRARAARREVLPISPVQAAVLFALWSRPVPLTGRAVHLQAGVGSYPGTLSALARLVEQGVVSARRVGSATEYVLNTEHVLYPVVDAATGANRPRAELDRGLLGKRPRGQDHGQAADVLETIRGAEESARALKRLLEDKDTAQYGTTYLTREKGASDAETRLGDARRVGRRPRSMRSWRSVCVVTDVSGPSRRACRSRQRVARRAEATTSACWSGRLRTSWHRVWTSRGRTPTMTTSRSSAGLRLAVVTEAAAAPLET